MFLEKPNQSCLPCSNSLHVRSDQDVLLWQQFLPSMSKTIGRSISMHEPLVMEDESVQIELPEIKRNVLILEPESDSLNSISHTPQIILSPYVTPIRTKIINSPEILTLDCHTTEEPTIKETNLSALPPNKKVNSLKGNEKNLKNISVQNTKKQTPATERLVDSAKTKRVEHVPLTLKESEEELPFYTNADKEPDEKIPDYSRLSLLIQQNENAPYFTKALEIDQDSPPNLVKSLDEPKVETKNPRNSQTNSSVKKSNVTNRPNTQMAVRKPNNVQRGKPQSLRK